MDKCEICGLELNSNEFTEEEHRLYFCCCPRCLNYFNKNNRHKYTKWKIIEIVSALFVFASAITLIYAIQNFNGNLMTISGVAALVFIGALLLCVEKKREFRRDELASRMYYFMLTHDIRGEWTAHELYKDIDSFTKRH